MVDPDPRLKAGDFLYLIAPNEELYGWGTVVGVKQYFDQRLNRDSFVVEASRPVVQPDLVSAQEIKKIPALARLFDYSEFNLLELQPTQINYFNRLIRARGKHAPPDVEGLSSHQAHLRRLVKTYEAANGSRGSLVELMEVLKDEVSSEQEAWDEADYMEGQGWLTIVGDNGPPLVRLSHNGIKTSQSYLSEITISDTNPPSEIDRLTDVEAPKAEVEIVDIFISLSHKDSKIADALIDLLKSALNLSDESIRCTGVDETRLEPGATIEGRLRNEINGARGFIGLISEESLKSTYVLFELGARWGLGQHFVPVLISGKDVELLKDPLKGYNPVSCDNPVQVHQLVKNIAAALSAQPNDPATYHRKLETLVRKAKTKKKGQVVKAQTVAEVDQRAVIRHRRSLITQEMTFNVEKLNEVYSLVKSEQEKFSATYKVDGQGGWHAEGDPVKALKNFHTSELSMKVWETHLHLAPSFIMDEEIQGVFAFYSGLNGVISAHQQFLGYLHSARNQASALLGVDELIKDVMERIYSVITTPIGLQDYSS